ncbi:putative serine/threonine-protein kinase WNK2 [Dichanthelium oligosanthes]|uniref:non-specific serine/threonine protein kinase n=1 Tax=Dichanthelium oligosanthes TaxID=888268 RepID=A0A1E5V050_9POAL|nr:putative serine/threonine-protein kinase WNK2 [Dichanthelium oligosanthes]
MPPTPPEPETEPEFAEVDPTGRYGRGEKPGSLAKIDDPEVKLFIEKCIAKAPERLSAKELLMDPFLLDVSDEKIFYPLHPDTTGSPNPSTSYRYDRVASSVGCHDHTGSMSDSHPADNYAHDTMDPHAAIGRSITVESQQKDLNTIFLKLRIADSTGHAQNIHFPFDIEADTSISVATEMVVQLDLTDQDVTAIAEMIDAEIRAHIPDWAAEESVDNQGDEGAHSETHSSESDEGTSELRNDLDAPHNGFVQERLPSGRKYWSDSPKRDGEISQPVVEPQIGDNMANGIPKRNDIDDIVSAKHEDQSFGSSIHPVEGIFERISSSVELSNSSAVDSISRGASVGSSPRSLDNEQEYNSDQHLAADATERLINLLAEQEEELSALQRKHKADIEDMLKSVPAEDREETLTRCRLKMDEKVRGDKL